MTPHLEAKKGDIAPTVLFPGDPLRAKWIADQFLTEVTCYNTIRNMLGFTGLTTDGKQITVQGSGMGMPSMAIYTNELYDKYDVQTIIRVGSAGGLQETLPPRSIVIAAGSCSDSALSHRRFDGMTFAPIADWELLKSATKTADRLGLSYSVGNNFATDKFYDDMWNDLAWEIFAQYGVLTVEMETAELYTLAAQKGRKALSILTVSDNLVTGEKLSAKDREQTMVDMVNIAIAI